MALLETTPEAVHVGAGDVPFVDLGDGSMMKVLQIRRREGVWVVEMMFPQGFVSPTHRHDGSVYGFTVSGAWKYREYDYVNRAGSYLYEPAGSVHTLECLEPDTRASFVVYGANIVLDDDGNFLGYADAESVLRIYLEQCEARGLGRPNVVIE